MLPAARFMGRSAVAVIVKGEGLPGISRRTGERFGMPVEGKVCGVEDDAAVEKGQNFFAELGHIFVPEFEVSAVFLLPILVQVDQQVETPIELEAIVTAKVNVHLEIASWLNLMQSTPFKVWIGN